MASRIPSGLDRDSSPENSLDNWLTAHGGVIAPVVVTLGFVCRVWAASGTFLNPDEALHFRIANQASLALAYRASLTTSHPPLLFVLLYWLRHLAHPELVLRLPSVVAGTAFCWVFYKWLNRTIGTVAGWIGLILVAFLPPMISLSAEVRQYALVLFFLGAGIYLMDRGLKENSPGLVLLCAICLDLGLLSHYSAVLFVAALVVYAIMSSIAQRISAPVIAAGALGGTSALGLLWLLYSTHLSKLGGSASEPQAVHGWMHDAYLRNSYYQPGHDHVLLFVVGRSGGVFQFIFGQRTMGVVAFAFFVVSIVLLLKGKALARNAPSDARRLGIFLLVPFAITCGASLARKYPYGGTRHCLFLAIFAVTGISLLLARVVGERSLRAVLAAGLIVLMCNLFGAPHRPYIVRSDQSSINMTRAIDSMRRQVPAGGLIFVDGQSNLLLGHYLCRQQPIVLDESVGNFPTFQCDGYRVVLTARTTIFDGKAFVSEWGEMVKAFGLTPGSNVWIFQAGWDVDSGLADEIHALRTSDAQSFGRNISLFKLTV